MFYYFIYLKVNLDLGRINQIGKYSPNFIFKTVNLYQIVLEKRWTDRESWPDNFDEKMSRGEEGKFKMLIDGCIKCFMFLKEKNIQHYDL